MPQESSNPKLVAAMQTLEALATSTGEPSLRDGILHFGDASVPRPDFVIVSQVQDDHDAYATLFVADGDSFTRAATNIYSDGVRAVGTELDPDGPVIGQLRNGESYAGPAQILDRDYDTFYRPILDSSQSVIGAYLVAEPI